MIDLQELEIFCFSAATVVDLALLFSLLEKRNWQKAMLPVVLLVLGSSLFHGAATLHIAVSDAATAWAGKISRTALAVMVTGLLLMPSAILHCMIELCSGKTAGKQPFRHSVLCYGPMLLLIPVINHLQNSSSRVFLEIFAPVSTPFMLWLAFANLSSAIGFYRGRKVYQQIPTQKFLKRLALLLVAITATGEWVIFHANPTWPGVAPYFTLFTAMTPLMLALLLAYYMMRYQLMQIIIERSLVYGVIIVVVLLFHHVFLKDLFNQISEHAQTDLALLEGALLIALIIAIQPLRQRVAEALRYLFGPRVSESRDLTRKISIQMGKLSGRPPSTIGYWFVDSVTEALKLDRAAIWLFNRDRTAVTFANNPKMLEDSMLFTIDRVLRRDRQFVCQAYDAPDQQISAVMYEIQASLILLIDNESIAGLVVLGSLPRGKTLNEEQRTALVLLAEQFSITLYNSELQASRLAAERQAIHNEKLSTLGLVASSIAHEIKNPLSSIKAIITVMAEDQKTNSAFQEDLEIVRQELDRLSETVTRLLKFVRPSGHSTLRCNVTAVVEDTLRIMKHVADQGSIKIQSEFDADLFASASESAIRDIVFNLIANAIDAAGQKGRIEIKCWRETNHVLLRIHDSGPGISEEIRARLYEPFISDKIGGTGLGLYMIGRQLKEIAGTIDYRNENGAMFTISIPVVLQSQTECTTLGIVHSEMSHVFKGFDR